MDQHDELKPEVRVLRHRLSRPGEGSVRIDEGLDMDMALRGVPNSRHIPSVRPCTICCEGNWAYLFQYGRDCRKMVVCPVIRGRTRFGEALWLGLCLKNDEHEEDNDGVELPVHLLRRDNHQVGAGDGFHAGRGQSGRSDPGIAP